MHHDGMVNVLHLIEGGDECFELVALIHIEIVQAHGTEEVVATSAIRPSERCEVLVKSAMVFGNRHLVVVDHDDKVRAQFGCPVKAFKCFTTTERPIADDGNHVARLAAQVATFGQATCQADRRGSMADDEMIVLALRGLGITRHVVVVRGLEKSFGATCQHFVGIALVGNVEDDFVLWRVKHVVYGDGGLHHAEVGTAVTTMAAHFLNEKRAYLHGEFLHFLQRKSLDIGWRLNTFDYH